jgi:hypothetical protein
LLAGQLGGRPIVIGRAGAVSACGNGAGAPGSIALVALVVPSGTRAATTPTKARDPAAAKRLARVKATTQCPPHDTSSAAKPRQSSAYGVTMKP